MLIFLFVSSRLSIRICDQTDEYVFNSLSHRPHLFSRHTKTYLMTSKDVESNLQLSRH